MQIFDDEQFLVLFIGWVFGLLTIRVNKRSDTKSTRNRIIFYLIQLSEELVKRNIADNLVRREAERGTKLSMQSLRKDAHKAIPDEYELTEKILNESLTHIAGVDPLIAYEIFSTLMPCQALHKRLLTSDFIEEQEFLMMLKCLSAMNLDQINRLEKICAYLARKNGLYVKFKTQKYFRDKRKHRLQPN